MRDGQTPGFSWGFSFDLTKYIKPIIGMITERTCYRARNSLRVAAPP